MTHGSRGPLRSLASPSPEAGLPVPGRLALVAGAAVAGLALAAVLNNRAARRAEADSPPPGRILAVDGVRLHVLERGEGPPLVLLHGNGTMVEDFVTSGLVAEASRTHRVIAVDRPGFGHSDRPRDRVWDADAQADVIALALGRMGVAGATVLGHSWGCSVAVALARRHPDLVGGLVLVSGYYYPTLRADVAGPTVIAVPLLGDALRHTVAPLLSRAMWPLALHAMFGPAPVPEAFGDFPAAMTFRPSQIAASAADAAVMVPQAAAAAGYGDLGLRVAVVAGEGDRIIDPAAQSGRLHAELGQSSYDLVPGSGHMVHQTAPWRVMAAIGRADGAAAGEAPALPVAA